MYFPEIIRAIHTESLTNTGKKKNKSRITLSAWLGWNHYLVNFLSDFLRTRSVVVLSLLTHWTDSYRGPSMVHALLCVFCWSSLSIFVFCLFCTYFYCSPPCILFVFILFLIFNIPWMIRRVCKKEYVMPSCWLQRCPCVTRPSEVTVLSTSSHP